jgi:Protein of unknown function (DUF3118).
MEHHIITRFNLRSSWAYDEAWFLDRLELFDKYTLPSLRRQTNKNFTWHLLFDQKRTKPHLEKLEALNHNGIDLRFHLFGEKEEPFEELKKQIYSEGEAILTSRVDNDDILHPDYVAVMQKEASKKLAEGLQKPELFDFMISYYWSPEQKTMTRRREYYPSPFSSLIEIGSPNEPLHTVYAGNHTKLHHQFSFNELPGAAAIAVVHGNNVLNGLKLHPRKLHSKWLRRMITQLQRKPVSISGKRLTRILAEFGVD